MVEENKSLKERYAELERSLIKAREEAEFYKNITVVTGRTHLRKIDHYIIKEWLLIIII